MTIQAPAEWDRPSLWDWLRTQADKLRAHPRVAKAAPVLQTGFVIGLIAYLAYCLLPLGWTAIWQARPTSWLFYALLPLSYFVLPVADLIIYRRMWQVRAPLGVQVFLRKCFMNNAFFDFSGETYLFVWARRHLGLPHGFLLSTVRDSSVLSGIAGWAFLIGLLVYLATSGHWMIPLTPTGSFWSYLLVACIPVLLCVIVAVARPKIAALTARTMAFVFTVHSTRVVVGHAVHVTMWSLALPSVSVVVWLNFLAVRILISRLGFLPNRDLLLLSAGLGMAGAMGVPHAGIAAVLLIITASEHVFNLLFVGLPSLANSARVLAAPKTAR